MVSRRVIRAVTPPPSLKSPPQVALDVHPTVMQPLRFGCGFDLLLGILKVPCMKTRWSIAGALLFALVLAPSALRASARPIGSSSCHVSKARFHSDSAAKRTRENLVQLVASAPSHHTPAPRLHRIRGKKINVQGSTILALRCFAASRYLVQDASSELQIIDGPNPSRGPPSQLSL
jgi:hypothetical protein